MAKIDNIKDFVQEKISKGEDSVEDIIAAAEKKIEEETGNE